MVNIYIITLKKSIFHKMNDGFMSNSYMDIKSFHLSSVKDLISQIDKSKDVDVALISEEILDDLSYNAIDQEIVKRRNIPYLLINTSKKILMDAVHSNAHDIILLDNLDIDRAVWSIMHAFERNKMINKLYEYSIEDDLTGLYNRRGFLNIANDSIKRMEDKNYFVMFIDLDKMKEINDDYGHDIGDVALKETANILKTSFREGDIISRFGGDEFVVFVHDNRLDIVEKIKNRLIESVKLFNSRDINLFKLSLSIGISNSKDINKNQTLSQVINRADKQMYKVKTEKYNQKKDNSV